MKRSHLPYVLSFDLLWVLHSVCVYQGAGRDEQALTRVMVSRCEVDMEEIKDRFKHHYGETLESYIKVLWSFSSENTCILSETPGVCTHCSQSVPEDDFCSN